MSRFPRADLHAASFIACKAPGSDFEDADFSRRAGRNSVALVTFSECILDMASFRGAMLDQCNLEGSSLTQADFTRASLKEANLQRADLSEAIVQGAEFERADLREANLTGFKLLDLKSRSGIKLSESSLKGLMAPLGIRVFPG